MVLHREKQSLEHTTFWHIGEYLNPGDLLVTNQTRVIPARLNAHKETGGRVEIVLLKRMDELTWEVLVGGKRVFEGCHLKIDGGPGVEVVDGLENSRRLLRFAEPIEPYLQSVGQMPLPPYIHTRLTDAERYQTVYATQPGSAAAPTAGLHFSPELLASLKEKGVGVVSVTLHVGLDTFAPVTEDAPEAHVIHSEWCEITPKTVEAVNDTRRCGGRVVAVGTTSVRTLETAARCAAAGQTVAEFKGATSLFILPGFSFQVVDALVTNFHLPRSTLLMLVSAFTGRERLLDAYRSAIEMEYRFYSFGDAMLIV
jgi:S-adenosylmethionine:tRNA ribosyltransferase-isomerase